MTARAMLAAALDLVRAGWARQALAEDWDGNRVRPWSARAQRWSATGALIAVWYRLPQRGDARPDLDRAYLALRATVGDVDAWNQAPERSHAEVVAAFEKASASSKNSPTRHWRPEAQVPTRARLLSSNEADREHDSAVDLRQAEGDRGHEARRSDQLVRAWGRSCSRASSAAWSEAWPPVLLLLLGRELALPAVFSDTIRESSIDVRAWDFSLIALILVAIGLLIGGLGSGLTLRRFLRV